MSTPLAANECRRQVRYDYTKDERIQKAITLGESLDRYAATEAELSRIKKDYTARLDGIQAEVDGLNLAVRTGYELREYICYWTYDEPKQGRKTLRKREGGEIFAEEDMTERDRQMVMEIIDKAAADNAAPSEKIALPAFRMPASAEDVVISEEDAQSFDIDADTAAAFTSQFADIFTDDGPMRDEDERAEELSGMLGWSQLDQFREWLTTGARVNYAGTAYVADYIAAHLRAKAIREQATNARIAAEKKAARTKGRRASASGTVEVAADEGSRDDAGSEGKNDL
jgi:hypothetical protein